MTFKQAMRRLFANLWHRCGQLALDKIIACHHSSTEYVAWWEDFLTRCEQRALRHSEHVPNEHPQESPAPFVPAVEPALVDGLTCVEWVKKYRNEKHCTLKAAKDEWDSLLRAREPQNDGAPK